MARPENYNTRQREIILEYIVSLDGAHVTAAQIVKHFETERMAVGRTTVYRHLDKLVEGGKLRRYYIDGVSGACYQYIEHENICREHFHLKCVGCGELIHLECTAINDLRRHLSTKHDFQVDIMKSVFYGKCKNCLH